MALDKAKALREANKYVSQGKIAKAIRQYERVVESEPSDLSLLNVIGDLYACENNVPEALKYFYRLADAYTHEGYKLKAIAIYRKIVKLDRGRVEPLLRLAELSSSQGLAREAREHFESALNFFERRGEHAQALEVLRKLCRMDPRDHALRLHLGQVAESAGESREAVEAYLGAAVLARDNGDPAASRSGLDRAAKLDPGNAEVHLLLARQALTDDKPRDVGEILGSVPALRSSPEAKRLLLESYLAIDDADAASGLLLDVLESSPSNFAPAARFVARSIQKGQYEPAFQLLKRAGPVLIARRETGPLMEALLALWEACPERVDILELIDDIAEKTADEAAIPGILQKLGDAYVRSGQLDKAEQVYVRLAPREPENERYKDLLRTVPGKHGRECAPHSQRPPINENGGPEPDAVSSELRRAQGASPQSEQTAILSGLLPPLWKADVAETVVDSRLPEPTVEFTLLQAEGAGSRSGDEAELPSPKEISLDFRSASSNKPSPEEPAVSAGDGSAGLSPQQSLAMQSQSQTPPPFDYEESREKVEFYLRHGFYQEARQTVEELEKSYPGESQVLELRRRLENEGPEMPSSAPPKAGQAAPMEEWDLTTCFFDSESGSGPVPGNPVPAGGVAPDETVGNVPGGLTGEADSTFDEVHGSARSAASPVRQVGQVGGAGASDDAVEDLASLLDELGDDSEPADQAADDAQTHYNLGVAFREMGLLDEAIGEFQKVVREAGPAALGPYFLQGCTLLASCFMEKEMPAIAARWYLRALDAPDLDFEGTLAVCYDLGIAFEKAGNTAAALEKFTEVYSQNIDYRDVAEKIRLLGQTSR